VHKAARCVEQHFFHSVSEAIVGRGVFTMLHSAAQRRRTYRSCQKNGDVASADVLRRTCLLIGGSAVTRVRLMTGRRPKKCALSKAEVDAGFRKFVGEETLLLDVVLGVVRADCRKEEKV
jgi:hypothetical protein